MRLDNRRTVLVGFAFLSICAFWQMYDNIIPLMLRSTFGMDEALTGTVMAADNVLALFLLPFFGALSDRTHTKIGRRIPYIVGGTAAAVLLMNGLPVLDNRYAAAPSAGVSAAFVLLLGLLLLAMGTYRSPAVALMPDVTPKPLRSKGNAIINLMGALGGILYLAAAAVLYSEDRVGGLAHVDYRPLFWVVSAIMAVSVLILFLTIREPQLSEEVRRYEEAHPEENLAKADESGREVLPRAVKRSLLFILLSVSLWYMAYNAVTTWFTTYVSVMMGRTLGGASTCLLVATGGAVLSYIPIGALSSRIGRKRTIQGGCYPLRHVLFLWLSPHHRLFRHSLEHVHYFCPGGPRLGGHQRQLPAHGSGDVPRRRRGKIYRLLLRLLYGGSGNYAYSLRLAFEPCGLSDPFPLRHGFHGAVLFDHVRGSAWG